jgi:hypothetical protein
MNQREKVRRNYRDAANAFSAVHHILVRGTQP